MGYRKLDSREFGLLKKLFENIVKTKNTVFYVVSYDLHFNMCCSVAHLNLILIILDF